MLVNLKNINYHAILPRSFQQKFTVISNGYTVKRIAKAVLPLIVMIIPLGRPLRFVGIVYSLSEAMKNKSNTMLKTLKVTYHVTSIGLLLINPMALTLIQCGSVVATNSYQLSKKLTNSEKKQAFVHAFPIIEKSLLIATIMVGGPDIVLISMCAQTAIRFYAFSQYQKKGMRLETNVQSLIIGIKFYRAYKLVEFNKVHFNKLFSKAKDFP